MSSEGQWVGQEQRCGRNRGIFESESCDNGFQSVKFIIDVLLRHLSNRINLEDLLCKAWFLNHSLLDQIVSHVVSHNTEIAFELRGTLAPQNISLLVVVRVTSRYGGRFGMNLASP